MRSRRLKRVLKFLEEGTLDCRSALHSTGMEETVLAAVPGDSRASTAYKPSSLQPGLVDRFVSFLLRCRSPNVDLVLASAQN